MKRANCKVGHCKGHNEPVGDRMQRWPSHNEKYHQSVSKNCKNSWKPTSDVEPLHHIKRLAKLEALRLESALLPLLLRKSQVN